MKFYSKDFDDYGPLDAKFTADGANVSPEFIISEVPSDAKTLILTMHDLDSPGGKMWTHWLAWDIPVTTSAISSESMPVESKQGQNSFKNIGYGGPDPGGGTGDHRYVFSLYAVDKKLDIPENVSRSTLLALMAGHIAAQSMWVGIYSKQ
jgi:Raf kinase inhibitor-like YbhB/YbcL family protein